MSALRSRSLAFQLAAAFLLVGLTPVLLLGAVALGTTLSAMRRGVEARNQAVAQAVAGEVERFLDSHLTHLREVMLASREPGERVVALQGHLALHLEANPALRSILLLDAAGRVVVAAPPAPDLIGIDFSGQPFVREARVRGLPTWSSATISMATGQPTVTLVLPGKPWIVLGFLDLEALTRIAERTGVASRTVAAIVDRDGTLIAHATSQLVRQQVNVGDLDLVTHALAGAGKTGRFRFEGSEWLGSSAPVPATRWAVLTMEPIESAFATVDELRTLLFVAVGAAAVLALAAGAYYARRILRPVAALAASTRRVAAGESSAPHERGRDPIEEIEELGRLFDAMSAAVRARERELARSERSYKRIVDTPMLVVVRTSVDGTILFANEGMARLNGLDDPARLVGRNIAPFYANPAERDAILRVLQAMGRVVNRELRVRTFAGEERTVLLNVVRDEDGITSVLVDVTDRLRAEEEKERLEQQLIHTQKVEAVGRLAGGVAHDFNNLLTAIMGYANVLREELPPGHDAGEAIDGILQASERAAHLTRSLLAYSRKQVLARRPVDLRDVIGAAARLIGRVLGEDVKLTVALPDDPLRVLADAGQIDQVLMNLCTNARDAMPAGGALAIRADRIILDAAQAQARELAAGGAFVRLQVVDSGVGMAPELVERVFEPFFTTKATGKGTGLGLAIVQGIVRQHDGAVTVDSRPGGGTTVNVLLPELPKEPPRLAPLEEDLSAAPRGTETVLLAEDDPQVRRVFRSILQRGGYQVIDVGDGRAAVEAFAEERDRISLCILDVVMPELNGRETLEAIRRIDPRVRVLFASGYTGDALAERTGEGLPEVIGKPVTPVALLRKVRKALDRTPS